MKVQLVANLSANGELILADQSGAYQALQEVAGMGIAKALECGNIIMGRTTYQMFTPMLKDVFANLEVVVIASEDIDGNVYTAKNAEDAVRYLESKGFEKVCVDGGAVTYNAFLESGLADELFFNFFPIIINGGGTLETAQGKVLQYKLAEAKSLGDVAMLHFIKK